MSESLSVVDGGADETNADTDTDIAFIEVLKACVVPAGLLQHGSQYSKNQSLLSEVMI